jgi:hypothetical protein
MLRRKLVLILGLALLTGSLAAFSYAKKICIPCTSYCKTHPNSPRCN